MSVTDINYFLALGTIFLQLVSIVLLVVFVMRNRMQAFEDIARSMGAWGLWIAFGVSFFASVLALYYSEVLGFEPCPLCWWQRVFLFPQVLLAGLAAWKKDAYMAEYSIILSVFGAGIALYQHVLQMM